MEHNQKIEYNYKRLKSLLMYIVIPNHYSENFWTGRCIEYLCTVYSLFDNLEDTQKKNNIDKLFHLAVLDAYSKTNNFERLNSFVLNLPGFNPNSFEHSPSAYEQLGYLNMQVHKHFANFQSSFINEDLKLSTLNDFGLLYILKKYEKHFLELPTENLCFNNAILNLKKQTICIISDNFNIYQQTVNFKDNSVSREFFKLNVENKDINGRTMIMSKTPDWINQNLFAEIMEKLSFDQIDKLSRKGFDLLNLTDNIDDLVDLIDLNYSS
tara:strand:- start:27028 stop:27831 length:804 start_codon:yes stop_codon:yes gene_type:complete